jgi:hypothetical protein
VPQVWRLVAALRLVRALITIKVRSLYAGYEVLSLLRMPKSLPGGGSRMFGNRGEVKRSNWKRMMAWPLGVVDDCSRRTHREVSMAVHRGTFCHPLSCLPLLRGENPPGATDGPEISVARLEIDQAEGVGTELANVLNGWLKGKTKRVSAR